MLRGREKFVRGVKEVYRIFAPCTVKNTERISEIQLADSPHQAFCWYVGMISTFLGNRTDRARKPKLSAGRDNQPAPAR